MLLKQWAGIKQCGHSDVVLGANQQPTFRPKYLTREIALLCNRTEYESPNLWNSRARGRRC